MGRNASTSCESCGCSVCVCVWERFSLLTAPVQARMAARCVWSSVITIAQQNGVQISQRCGFASASLPMYPSAPQDHGAPYDVCFASSVLSTDVAKKKRKKAPHILCGCLSLCLPLNFCTFSLCLPAVTGRACYTHCLVSRTELCICWASGHPWESPHVLSSRLCACNSTDV